MIHAIIDIGSNTVRMAVYLIEGETVDMLMKKKRMVGLAAYLKDGVMQQEGIDYAVNVLSEFRDFLRSLRITSITAFTTAALRNASNGMAAVEEIRRRTGLAVRIISGDEEAVFDFLGATHDLTEDTGLLIDIGGASTEIVYYERRAIERKISLHIGSLLFHTRYSREVLPSAEEAGRMREAAESELAQAQGVSGISHAQICGIGGTFKGASALYHAIYGGAKGAPMEAARIPEIIRRFQMEEGLRQENMILLMKHVPERMHTVIPGLVIADVLAKHFGSERIVYSDSGVREGYIYDQIIGKAS